MTGTSNNDVIIPAHHSRSSHTPKQKFVGQPHILGPAFLRLPTLTIGLLGVQIFWSIEMGYAPPYLLSLGLSKPVMSLVFLAGPLSGLVMQPLVGHIADNARWKLGRRRPVILAGTGVCVLGMGLLGFTRGFVGLFTGMGREQGGAVVVVFAVVAVYLIDFAINAVTAMDRALLVDTLPPARQAAGNAWAARMLGLGSVVGFSVGSVKELEKKVPWAGKTELEVLSVLVSVVLILGHGVVIGCVKERVLVGGGTTAADKDRFGKERKRGIRKEVRELWRNVVELPSVIRQICFIQFFAWISWFPQLFYTTIYIGELYKRSIPSSPTPFSQADVEAEATRLGTRALFFASLLSLGLNLFLPTFVATPATRTRSRAGSETTPLASAMHDHGGSVPSTAVGGTRWTVPEKMKVNLATLWAVSLLILSGCMLGNLFTDTVTGATVLVSVTGFPWAMSQWAPFSLLAEAILTTPLPNEARESIALADVRTPSDGDGIGSNNTGQRGDEDERAGFLESERRDREDEGSVSDGEIRETMRTTLMGNLHARTSLGDLHLHPADGRGEEDWEDVGRDVVEDVPARRPNDQEDTTSSGGGLSAKAGVILGIHNVFIVIPQFLVTGMAAIVFALTETPPNHIVLHPVVPVTPGGIPGNITITGNSMTVVRIAKRAVTEQVVGRASSVVYVFRIGGVSALIAFILCWRLARQLRHR